MQSLDLALEVFPNPEAPEEDRHSPGTGADFVLSMISEALKSIKSEQSLLQYLDSLLDLKGCTYLQTLRRATRLDLQVQHTCFVDNNRVARLQEPVFA